MFALVAYSDPLQLSAGSAEVLDLWQAHSDGDVLELLATDDPRHVAGLSDNDPGAEIDPVPFLNRAGDAPNGLINGRERLVPGDRLVWLGLQDGTTDCTSALFEAADYCQVVGRTWNPKASPDGWPLLVNVLTVDEFPTAMMEPIRQALALPVPREWAPRPSEESDGWPAPGTSPPSPAHWLRQLAPPPKRGKPAESGNRSPEGDE